MYDVNLLLSVPALPLLVTTWVVFCANAFDMDDI